MKEVGTSHWSSPNTSATNSSGFTGLRAGVRNSDENFYDLTLNEIFWKPSEYSGGISSYVDLNYSEANVSFGNAQKTFGYSVRCIKN